MSPELVDELADSVRMGNSLLSRFRFRAGEHYLQDRVVFGFLWQAVACGEVILQALRAGHPFGLWPSVRQLIEILGDLSYLELHADADLIAATIVLSEAHSFRAFWEASEGIGAEDESLAISL
jgi:hypothetical protein